MAIGTRRPGGTRPGLWCLWIACAGLAALQPNAYGEPLRLHVAEETHMGIVVRIAAYFPPDASPPRTFREAFDRIGSLAARFSSYREDSELRLLEATAWREPVPVSPEFAFLLEQALRLARDSGGAFDPTLGSVTRLLRAESRPLGGPEEELLREAWSRTGWEGISLDMETRTVSLAHRGMQLDLGGIAKGYIADEALAKVRMRGVPRAMVAVAGDIAVGDPPPDAAGWPIGLDRLGPRGSVERKLLLSNEGVSTSGSRERRFRLGDRPCSHILSRSGDGCADPARAVSVIAPTALEADGTATALIALGPDLAEEFLEKRPEITALWADR